MTTTKLIIMVFTLMVFSQTMFAQDCDIYLQKAQQRLDEGDCEGAQKNYNVYKELSGRALTSFEVLIEDCLDENRFHIGDNMNVNGENYIIAYLTENHQHGFAIQDVGVHSLFTQQTLGYLSNQKIPSLEELNIIYKNNAKIGLTGTYWTRSVHMISGYHSYYYIIDFISGKQQYSHENNKNGILLIHRF